jgi:hypothetical protein
MIFELELIGFDGSGNTDHLIKWVVAPSEEVLTAWLEVTGIKLFLNASPVEIYHGETMDFCNGIDVKLSENGDVETPSWSGPEATPIAWARESIEAQA